MTLDERVRELYAGPPDTFIDRRKELAKALRADGDKEGAAAVGKLRRPSRAAWALNRVVAAHHDDLNELVDIGRQLQDVQRGAGGGAADLRRLAGERRAVIVRLADAAVAELGGDDTAALREKLQGTLEAASTESEVADALAAGTLDKEQDPPSGFGPLGLAPVPKPDSSEAPPEAEEPEEPDRTPELEAELAEVEAQLKRAEMRITALEDELDGARRRADGFARRRDALNDELRDLRQ